MQSTGTTPALFSAIRITLHHRESTRALVSLKVADAMYLTGFRIVEGKNGPFVSMPSKKDPGGEYRDIFFPASREMRDRLNAAVIEAYNAELAKHAEEAGEQP